LENVIQAYITQKKYFSQNSGISGNPGKILSFNPVSFFNFCVIITQFFPNWTKGVFESMLLLWVPDF